MTNRSAGVFAAALVAGGIAGCSSPRPPASLVAPGTLPAGTAQVMINGKDAVGTTQEVSCLALGSLTIVTIGDRTSGVTAYVSNKNRLVAQTVSIRDLGGFTGSFNAGLNGNADVSMIDKTYDITGTADGFTTARPEARLARPFAITVSC